MTYDTDEFYPSVEEFASYTKRVKKMNLKLKQNLQKLYLKKKGPIVYIIFPIYYSNIQIDRQNIKR